MGTFEILDIIMERQVNFYVNMYHHTSKFMSDFMKNIFIYKSSYSMSNLYSFVHKFNVPVNDVLLMKKPAIRRAIQAKYNDLNWRIPMINELLDCIEGVGENGLVKDELLFMLDFICTER